MRKVKLQDHKSIDFFLVLLFKLIIFIDSLINKSLIFQKLTLFSFVTVSDISILV